ncbi:GntR family transcriptional regulator [Oceaniglobus roseus]|uniref:GntR family transcriptional regulator n=1 Tax=Oceaniglobus roseus TaxID=1737570 RepID=UPI000C7ECC60|nr:GntR family transcriptional regulator [Kandeliimicrobium roseum]
MIDTTDIEDGPQGNGAYRRLLEEISRGDLLPGARLRETELAERLGISRTPVREAIRQLEADGLVAHVPRQGATIRVLDYTEVMELYEMRAVLEGTAARLAARAASDLELDELAALNEELAATGDLRLAYDLNRQFHLTLLDAAKNRYLIRSVNALQKTLLILGPSTLAEADRAKQAVEEHAALLDALKARDGTRAEALMRAHIEAAHRVRLKALRGRERPIDAV